LWACGWREVMVDGWVGGLFWFECARVHMLKLCVLLHPRRVALVRGMAMLCPPSVPVCSKW
jgi:hypothetical protein